MEIERITSEREVRLCSTLVSSLSGIGESVDRRSSSYRTAALSSSPLHGSVCDADWEAQCQVPKPFGELLGSGLGVDGFSNGAVEDISEEPSVLPATLVPCGRSPTSSKGFVTAKDLGEAEDTSAAKPEHPPTSNENTGQGATEPEANDQTVFVYCGMKWECLEYSRRFLILRYGVSFESMDGAHCLWDHDKFFRLESGEPAPFRRVRNAEADAPPPIGALLLYPVVYPAADLPCGHVAVVVERTPHHIHVAEQNWDNTVWAHRRYSRSIPFIKNEKGKYEVVDEDPYTVLGWLDFNNDRIDL